MILFSLQSPGAWSQDSNQNELEGIFISGGVECLFAPGELSKYAATKPGWRAGAGWTLTINEKHSFPFYIEGGHSYVSGTNPLVRSLDIIPLSVYGGWTFSPVALLDLCIQIGAGGYFASVDHYETALAEGNLSTSSGSGLIVGAKLGAGVSLFERSIEIHLLGTVECILEKDGPLPLPGLTVSCSVYPVRIYSKQKR